MSYWRIKQVRKVNGRTNKTHRPGHAHKSTDLRDQGEACEGGCITEVARRIRPPQASLPLLDRQCCHIWWRPPSPAQGCPCRTHSDSRVWRTQGGTWKGRRKNN